MLRLKDMKSLKFDHELAQLIAAGQKTSTWRVNDDKDLHVNDRVSIIDKVDAAKPATWKAIGEGRIRQILEKPYREIGPADVAEKKELESPELLKKHYGESIDSNAIVKIIHFDFTPTAGKPVDTNADEKTTELTEVKVYADGGSRGNPGPSSSGFVVMDMDDTVLVENGQYLGITTNNQAEYNALKLGLEEALAQGARTVHVYMDSLLVINQMKGVFKVRNRDLWPVHEAIKQLCTRFEKVTFTHVPRELNKLADAVVNNILDSAASN